MTGTASEGGIWFFGLLTIALLVLKACKLIDCSWWWVFAPLWLPFVAFVGVVLVFMVFMWMEDFFSWIGR